MKKELIIALDIGTSGCRAAAVRTDGTLAAQHYLPLLPKRPAPGLSHYEAADLVAAVKQSLHAVLDKTGPQNAAALAVTSQRSTVVVWDKQTGQAVGPVLTWEDGRAQAQAQNAAIRQEDVHVLTGLYKTPFFSAPKIAWTLENFPVCKELLKEGRLGVAPVASYIIWHLTCGKTFATDLTLAQRTLLTDIHKQTWSENLCQAFGIPTEMLPQLKPSAADYGAYAYQGVSIPITACVGDQQSAAVYFGLQKNKSLINYGTGAFWLYNAGENPVLLPGMLTSLSANGSGQTSSYLLEGPVNSAGSALLWLKAQGILFDDTEIDALCARAKNPVWFLPAFGGLGAPYWNFNTPTTVDGLSPHTQKPDWVAGVVRGVAFLLADIGAYLRANGCVVKGPVQVAGGLSHLSYLTQFQADLLQLPLEVSHQSDATVLGAAMLGAKTLGVSCVCAPAYTQVSPKLSGAEAETLYGAWREFVAHSLKK